VKPDKHQEFALRTWYPKDHPLHNDAMPALLGLVGEAGEITELVKKAAYKYEIPVSRDSMLEELGDYWWYLRIVAYIRGVKLRKMQDYDNGDLQTLCIKLCYYSSVVGYFNIDNHSFINYCLTCPSSILAMFDCSLDELTEMNYQKLSGGKHGWEEY